MGAGWPPTGFCWGWCNAGGWLGSRESGHPLNCSLFVVEFWCGRQATQTPPLPQGEPMDPGFQPGERITAHMSDLTVDAVRVDDDERTWVLVAHFGSDGSVAGLALPVGTGIRFERVIPADGEPQPGELWADQVDNLYFAQLGPSGGPAWLVDVDAPGSGEPWEQVHRSADGPIYRVAQRPLIGGQS